MPKMAPTAGITIIGSEILSGKFADQNTPFLIGELRDLGVDLCRIVVLPDDTTDIAITVASMSAAFDHVFTSGGVGPTHDDVTMESIAKGFDVGLEPLAELVELLRAHYGNEPTAAQMRLAMAPEGAQLVYGTDPKWPVTQFRNITILPGVPPLFRKKFLSIRESFRGVPKLTERVRIRGDESEFADELTAIVRAHPRVEIGSYPRFEAKRFHVVLALESRDAKALELAVAAVREGLADRLFEDDKPAEE